MKKITQEQAATQGFTIDTHARVAYKGPTFNPTESVPLFSEDEERLIKSLKRMLAMHDAMFAKTNVAGSFYDGPTIAEMNQAPLEARSILKEMGAM